MRPSNRYQGPERRGAGRDPAFARSMRALFDLLRWIARHAHGFYSALGLYLLIGLLAMLAGGLLFGGLAVLMQEGVTQSADEAILLWMDRYATPSLDVAALEVTALGSSVVVVITLLITSAFLWVTRHRYSVLLLWSAYAGASLLTLFLKALFDRPRPDVFPWRVPYAGHASFPSGHATTAAVVYATLAYLIARLEPTRLTRRITLLIAAVVIVLIGLSRVYLGVHYPSDVLGGFIVGLAWATFCALGIEAVRYFRSRRPEVGGEEADLEEGTEPLRDAVRAHPGPEGE